MSEITASKEIVRKPIRFTSGHTLCSGCGIPMIVRTILAATDKPVVVANATGCLEVASTIFPYTSWNTPYIHSLFENTAATLSGVERAYVALKKKGEMKKDIKFVVFAGDGGTYDIGLQALSGAFERGHDMLYVCYDNEGYMNTGNQRSSATPYGANTTTEPAGKVSFGKHTFRKDIVRIVAAHNVPYVAQASVGNLEDLLAKAKKALEIEGPTFLNVLMPCTALWKFPSNKTIEIAKLATDTNFWPLYEIENGKYKINYEPKERIPVEKFLKTQGRFRHLFKPENKHVIEELQKHIDEEWKKLKRRCEL